MNDINKVTARRDNASIGSSFMEVFGQESIRTKATCSSTIREVLDVDTRFEIAMPPIHEEPPYSMPDDAFTELCATCLLSHDTRKEATHFCPGCDRRGRYMCGNCLKAHSVWCNKPEHEVQCLSVDRHSDPELCYHTIEQSVRNRPKRNRASSSADKSVQLLLNSDMYNIQTESHEICAHNKMFIRRKYIIYVLFDSLKVFHAKTET